MARNLFEYHPVLGYRFIPGLLARVSHEAGGYLVRCNQAGFRCDHEVTPRSDDRFRVLVFGDSYTAGDGVNNGKRYTDLLESRLEGAEVLNFGMPGSGTDQQFLAYQIFTREIDYDLLIISTQVANIWRLKGHHLTLGAVDGRVVRRSKPYYRLDRGELVLENQPVPREVEAVDPTELELAEDKAAGRLTYLIRKVYRRWPELHYLAMRLRGIRSPAEYDDPNDPSWQLLKAILLAWIRQARAPAILCPIPTFGHVGKCLSADGYLRRFAELGAEGQAEVVDLLPAFWKLSTADRKRCRFAVDDHPTELGHAVMADALYPFVRNHYEQWMAKSRAQRQVYHA
jgi:carbamoyltransferase